MKSTELREKSDADLAELETQLREQLLQLHVAKATQRANNVAHFSSLRRDIARIKTIQGERKRGITSKAAEETQS
jgi:large subunit ribosomal protein L29